MVKNLKSARGGIKIRVKYFNRTLGYNKIRVKYFNRTLGYNENENYRKNSNLF